MASPTAYKLPGTAASVDHPTGTYGWTNPTLIKSDDGNVADAASGKGPVYTEWLRGTNFGFSSSDIPEGNIISGIEVQIERRAANANVNYDYQLYLVLNGSSVGNNYASATKYPSTLTVATYGGASDTWGAGLTRANVLDSTFGIQLCACEDLSNTYVDYIKIRVYYTEGAAGSLPLKNVFGRPFSGVFR